MFVRKAALRPIPAYAVVPLGAVESIETTLGDEDEVLQEFLDRGYADLDRRQPTLAMWMAEKLSTTSDELVQSLGYFLSVTVYLAFREAFPRRLGTIDKGMLELADATLEVDEQLRASDPDEILDSDDVLAMNQPSVVSFIQHHVSEALEQSGGDVVLEQLDGVYRALLVLVIALSHGVDSPAGTSPASAN